MSSEKYFYNGKEFNSIVDLAKEYNVSPLFLEVTLDDTRTIDAAIRDAREMGSVLDEICADLNEEQRLKNEEFDRSLVY